MSSIPRQQVLVNTAPPYVALRPNEKLATVMTVATSDASGGAGIEADLKTFTAHKCYGMTCLAALTAQTPQGVYSIHEVPKEHFELALKCNLRDMQVDAIKTGMLTQNAVDVMQDVLGAMAPQDRPPMVVDPVLVASSGASLVSDDSVIQGIKKLALLATLLTPNVHEASRLLGMSEEELNLTSVERQILIAQKLQKATGCPNILLKGGHAPWTDAKGNQYVTDVLYTKNGKCVVYQSERCDSEDTHGTGCTLGSAIASNLAHGETLEHAIYGAIQYVHNAIQVGCTVVKPHVKGNGPINHVYAIKMPLQEMVKDMCYSAHALAINDDEDVEDEAEMARSKSSSSRSSSASSLVSQIRDSGHFFEYLISDPRVKPYWDSYTKHEFVRRVADGSLEREKFKYFLEQDYAYLDNYAQVHCIAASKAPTSDDFDKSVQIVTSIKTEMSKHREKMAKHFGIQDMKHFDDIKMGSALKNYARFFDDVTKHGTWVHICAALSPCLMGYGCALSEVKDKITVGQDDIYYSWCQDYLAPWYVDAMQEGLVLLDRVCQMTDDWDALCEIYATVCKLETEFWDAALDYDANTQE
ncbi:LANO_0G06128g1_1 [Lachancea nothofagi CBS 11611]|uniref:LANO_0G06128g1_1 n=1 Tax=Lachancea nothofagi CBS 11611 TaxID=1266666 RepID=A0A1G4KGY2_9SACH|nr:LANO_0G06128g1_1 [Lachancea nothofagi CBS 11611]